MVITAKYRATCTACRRPIHVGDPILWSRRTRPQHVSCSVAIAREQTVSHVFELNSGAVVYVNRRGRCEDAPCCGCCS